MGLPPSPLPRQHSLWMTPYMKWRTKNVQNTALCREVAAAVATVSLLSRALHLVHIKAFVSILIWGAKAHIFMKATKFDEISQFCFDAKRKLGEFHHILPPSWKRSNLTIIDYLYFYFSSYFWSPKNSLGGKTLLAPL